MIPSLPKVPAPGAAQGPTLRDIHLPAEPSWWPPAPGWWLLAGLALVLLGVGVWWWRRWRHAVRARQRVLDEVQQLRLRHQREPDTARLAGDLHQLLRRVARAHEPAAAQQQGAAWQATLARVPVDAATLQQLLAVEEALYRADVSFDPPRALAAAEAWLRVALRGRKWKPAESTHA